MTFKTLDHTQLELKKEKNTKLNVFLIYTAHTYEQEGSNSILHSLIFIHRLTPAPKRTHTYGIERVREL